MQLLGHDMSIFEGNSKKMAPNEERGPHHFEQLTWCTCWNGDQTERTSHPYVSCMWAWTNCPWKNLGRLWHVYIRTAGRLYKLQLTSVDSQLRMWTCSGTNSYWKGSWAVFNWKCPPFLMHRSICHAINQWRVALDEFYSSLASQLISFCSVLITFWNDGWH